jgi:ferrous iron transport protein A
VNKMMMTMARAGEPIVIDRIIGQDKTISFLHSLGFVENQNVKIISEIGGNIILEVKDSRIAIDKNLAKKIIVRRRSINENIGQSEIGRNGNCGKNRRSRTCQKTHHGHGHHQGMQDRCEEGSTAW